VTDDQDRGSLAEGALVGGRYKVDRLIGRGGMGEVYAARHTTTGKEVALKLIHAAAGSGKNRVRRFLREARAATAIEHPNVIDVFDVFEDADGTPVMVMELLKGEPFSAYRARAGALELYDTARILLPAVRAQQGAHAKGIVHRDLKPDNVFLANTPAGRTTKLLDFGIAKVLDPTKLGSETRGQSTNTGSILGTPHYMSFEQAMSDKEVDHRTDIWALGVMIFESLTGRRPMTYDTLGQMYANFLQGKVPSIQDFVPELPGDAAHAIDACLAKQREDRSGDLGPLIAILEKYSDPDVPGAHSGGRVVAAPLAGAAASTPGPLSQSVAGADSKRRSRAALVAGVVLVGAGVGAAGVALSRGRLASVADQVVAQPLPTASAATSFTPSDAAPSTPPPPPTSTAPAASSPAHSPPVGSRTSPSATHVAPISPAPSHIPTPAGALSSSPTKRGISEKLPY
jgi:serine/threonine protein kinase